MFYPSFNVHLIENGRNCALLFAKTCALLIAKTCAFLIAKTCALLFSVYRLPAKIEKENFFTQIYNKTVGSNWYQENARSVVEKVMGGSLRLFTEHVFEGSFYASPQRTTLTVRGKMPEGSTVQQLNEAVRKMENYISKFDEVEMFQTSITGYRNSSITINFKPEYEDGSFPFYLKGELTSKAINLGGLDWGVYGVGRGFSNVIYTGYRNSNIILDGYNYDKLYEYAELLRKKLLEYPRIKEIDITGTDRWGSASLHEYFIDFDREQFGLHDITLYGFYKFLNDRVYRRSLTSVFNNEESQPVTMVANRAGVFNVWDMSNEPIQIEDKSFKLTSLGSIDKRKTGNDIYKYNQQYRLVVAYDFIGPGPLVRIVQDRNIETMNEILPLGYKAKERGGGIWWDRGNKKQYYLLLLVIVIIYFICCILLESFVQLLTSVINLTTKQDKTLPPF